MDSDYGKDVKSNIDIPSNIVIATRWNVIKYHYILHTWWIMKGSITRFFWEGMTWK